jgi:hypothetical protein
VLPALPLAPARGVGSLTLNALNGRHVVAAFCGDELSADLVHSDFCTFGFMVSFAAPSFVVVFDRSDRRQNVIPDFSAQIVRHGAVKLIAFAGHPGVPVSRSAVFLSNCREPIMAKVNQ